MIEKVFFQLVCFAKWTLVSAYIDEVTLKSGSRYLFNFETEEWVLAPTTEICFYRNGKYKITEGYHLSIYEMEIIQSLRYKRIK
jgi:hypothetical protein